MEQTLTVRINGTTSSSPSSASSSCSIFSNKDVNFHLLVGAGTGVSASVKKGNEELRAETEGPNAILITHAHGDQISELPQFVSANSSLKIYCTKESGEQIGKDFPGLTSNLSLVVPGQNFEVGPFSVTPIQADHAGDNISSPGAVIYIVRMDQYKVICGWDFLTLHSTDNAIFWNPDLLILGAETYNEHPSTGVISVSEAYDIIRRWNAKECIILGYNGQKDTEDRKNQWFRGPTRPLNPDELQNTIDDHLRVSGAGGKFSVKVGRQGMVWSPRVEIKHEDEEVRDAIEVEGIDKYVLKIEKIPAGVRVMVEDSIHRLESEFVQPRIVGGAGLAAEGIKGFMAKGPELQMTVVPQEPIAIVKVHIAKGKKPVISDDIRVSAQDARKLIRYINHHFSPAAQTVTST